MSKAKELLSLLEDLGGFKRVTLSDQPNTGSHVPPNSVGVSSATAIAWFSNKYNPAGGWTLHDTTPAEKKEFGKDSLRSMSDTGKTSIIKFDLKKGTYAFVDNDAYEQGDVKFEKMVPYQKVVLKNKDSLKFFK